MERPLALVVCDQAGARQRLREVLTRTGVEVLETGSGAVALEFIRTRQVRVLLADLSAPDVATAEFLGRARRLRPTLVPLVLISGSGGGSASQLVRDGAFDVLTEPIESHQVRITVDRALAQNRLMEELARLRARLRARSAYHGLVGQSAVMEHLRERLERQAGLDTPMLLLGEQGSGKEEAARAVHAMSARRDGPFVALDCTSLDGEALDSELFGYQRGDVPDSGRRGVGLLDGAEGGCLFLGEIEALSLTLQGRLLEALNERTLRRVGDTVHLPLNVRILSASSRDVERALHEGRLREDLYQRLSAGVIKLAPLRERREDVAPLARHFIDAICEINNLSPFHLSPGVLELLEGYRWPGNIRELRNAMEQAVILATDETIRPRDLPQRIRQAVAVPVSPGEADSGRPFRVAKKEVVEVFERTYLSDLLQRHRGNVTAAAQEAGMLRSALQRLLRKYDMRSADFRRSRHEKATKGRA